MYGAKNAPRIVLYGEYYRLITPAFLHAGIFHIIGNLAMQLEDGARFESSWGHAKWLIVYFCSAIGGSLGSAVYMPGMLGVGASGALLGLLGARQSESFVRMFSHDYAEALPAADRMKEMESGHYRIMEELRSIKEERRQRKQEHYRKVFKVCSCQVILIALLSFIPLIDWAAHAGGYMTGVLLGLGLFTWPRLCLRRTCRTLTFLVGCVACVGMFYLLTFLMRELANLDVEPYRVLLDVCEYYKTIIPDYECSCVSGE
jgi:rhomboid protease GluP